MPSCNGVGSVSAAFGAGQVNVPILLLDDGGNIMLDDNNEPMFV